MATKKSAAKSTAVSKQMMPEDDVVIVEDGGISTIPPNKGDKTLAKVMAKSFWRTFVHRSGQDLNGFKNSKNHTINYSPAAIKFTAASVLKDGDPQSQVPSSFIWIRIVTHTATIMVKQASGKLKIQTTASWKENTEDSRPVFSTAGDSKIASIQFNNGKTFTFVAGEAARLTLVRSENFN